MDLNESVIPMHPERSELELAHAEIARLRLALVNVQLEGEQMRASEQCLLEQEVAAAKEKQERLRQEKEEAVARLTSSIAHDFNNVLAIVCGFAERSLEGVPEETSLKRNLTEILKAAQRAARLTRQLMAFAGKQMVEPHTIPLRGYFEKVRPKLQEIVGNAIELQFAIHGEPAVWMDPEQFEVVLIQLLTNARDAMPEGGRVTLEALQLFLGPDERPNNGTEDAISYTQLAVSDTGCGMDQPTLARIWEPFFTTKPAGLGNGLGLSTCQGIVKQGGGHMTVSSVPGHGTTFHLYLPSHDEEALEDSRTLPSTPEASAATATILVVDDEPMLRELGEAILLEAGYAVLVAEDGPSALRIFQERAETHSPPVDLLLTDVVMPGMNGVQLADQVRQLCPGLPILYCSGFTRDAIAEHGGLPAHSAFLQKPYSVGSLVEKVQALLAAR